MLLSIIAVVVLFAIARFFLARYTGNLGLANGVAGAIVCAFVLGLVSARLFGFRGTSAALAPSVGPAAAVNGPAVAPAAGRIEGRAVSRECRPARVGSEGAAGNVDLVTRDGAVTQLADGGTLDGAATYAVSGWAATPEADRTASAVCLAVDGAVEPRAIAYYFAPRPDVAAYYHQPALAEAGYTIVIPAGLLKRGVHRIQVAVKLPDGSVRALPGARGITVR
jgi:hypothetical protein